jgi:transcriptional regulator with XRE-family HTH domain
MTQPLTESVAAEVRAELARRNITRTDAARALGISRTLLWNRLRGETPFTVAELELLGELLGIPAVRFFDQPPTASAA